MGAILSSRPIYNESMRTGVIPMDLRDAIVTPLFKNGSRSETNKSNFHSMQGAGDIYM